jgi:transposase-like protein
MGVTDALGLTLDYKCDLCGRTFTNSRALNAHKNWHKNRQMLTETSRQALLKRWQMMQWSQAEDDFLKQNYDKLNTSEIAKQLRRSIRSVYRRAKKLGLNLQAAAKNKVMKCPICQKEYGLLSIKGHMAWHKHREKLSQVSKEIWNKYWKERKPEWYSTKDEELVRLYVDEKLGYKEIAKILGVSQHSVFKRLHRLGISGVPKSWSRKRHDEAMLKVLAEFQQKGYRCIPIMNVVPDAILIKGDNAKVYAFEFERRTHDISPEKYEGVTWFDDIIWVIDKSEFTPRSLKSTLNKLKGRGSVIQW